MLLFSSFSVIHVSYDIAILKGQSRKNLWRRTFVAMLITYFCTALRPNPYGESRVSEERDILDFDGDGTSQHWSLCGTSSLLEAQEAQQDILSDVVLAC